MFVDSSASGMPSVLGEPRDDFGEPVQCAQGVRFIQRMHVEENPLRAGTEVFLGQLVIAGYAAHGDRQAARPCSVNQPRARRTSSGVDVPA
ncbi:Uncharacterised protein [Mycobacteroides abscessus]|nr:Uncharacterised protein [Mycobacteroides abscessus]